MSTLSGIVKIMYLAHTVDTLVNSDCEIWKFWSRIFCFISHLQAELVSQDNKMCHIDFVEPN